MRRLVPFTLACALAVTALVSALDTPTPASRAPSPAPTATPVEATPHPITDPAEHAISRRARYAMTHRTTYSVDGHPQDPIEVRATWEMDPIGHGIRLSEVDLSDHPALPSAAALAGVYRLDVADGVLRGVRAPADTSLEARRTVAGLAAAFWMTPGPGATWTVEEQDVTGRAVARYVRRGDTVVRTVERALGVHGPDGLITAAAAGMRPGGQTVFTTDARGLVRAVVDTTLDVDDAASGTRIGVRIEAELRRLDGVPDAIHTRGLVAFGFDTLIDRADQSRLVDQERVDGADVDTLLAELARLEQLDRTTSREARSALLKRMAALVRLDPDAAQRFAAAIVDKAAAGEPVGLLTGALASAHDPAATDALAGTLEHLDGRALHGATTTLGLAHTPTVESLETLRGQLDGQYDEAAAMALGTQARKLAEDAPDEAGSAIDLLVERCAATPAPAREPCLLALGNSGDRRALPLLADALADGRLRQTALWALRFVPGEEVDALLQPWALAGGVEGIAALRAVAYRDPARWAPLLSEVRPVFEALGEPAAERLALIDGLLRRWGV